MKTTALLLLCFVFTANFCSGQNLVPNPSFEDTVECPFGAANMDAATYWFSANASPDYLNSCANNSTPNVGVPDNWGGTQQPLQGKAYAALTTYTLLPSVNYREIISTSLTSPLNSGTRYFVSGYISHAFSDIAQCASNNFGFKFSMHAYHAGTNPAIINNSAHINIDTVVSDTINWIWVGGAFIADSDYQYLMIGNFYDDTHTDTFECAPISGNSAYYFIDCLCVSTDSATCSTRSFTGLVKQSPLLKDVIVYPNPAYSLVSIKSEGSTSFQLINTLGRIAMEGTLTNGHAIIDVAHLPKGIYAVLVDKLTTKQILIVN